MNLLMTDTPLQVQMPKSGENRYIDLSQLKIGHCLGCFGCWVKTPGKCVIRDDATTVYPLIAKSENLIYVTRVCFGSYDVPMKTMLERAIPTQQAFLRLHNGEIHHVQRAVKEKKAVILAYGTESKEEQGLFQRLIERNANNMLFQSWRVLFVKEEQLAEAAQREVEAWEKS